MFRPKLAAVLTAGALLVPTGGCGTDAVGVDTCRDIEYARCEAAAKCPDLFDIPDVDDCKRFYRDQCLHGLAASREPGAPKLHACVEAIRQAGRCAARDQSLAECGSLQDESIDAETPCDVIQAPEKLDACSFLVPEPESENDEDQDEGSAGSNGAGGSG